MNLPDYENWLKGREYRPATIKGSLLGLKAVRAQFDSGVPMQTLVQNYHSYQYVRRYCAWLTQASIAPSDKFDRDALLFAPDGVSLAPRRSKTRVRPAVSVRADDWGKLVAALQADSTLEGRVLYAISCTALRIGDMLGLRREALVAGLAGGTLELQQKGGHLRQIPIGEGTRAAWERLLTVWPDHRWPGVETVPGATLAGLLSPGSPWGSYAGGAAYQRLHRHLKSVCKALGVSGSAYSHRLRRTVAVQALRLTKDARLVKDLLGHKSLNSTEYYIDELRVDDLAELQSKLNPTARAPSSAVNGAAAQKSGAPPDKSTRRSIAIAGSSPREVELRAPRCPYCLVLAPVQASIAQPPKQCSGCKRMVRAIEWR